MYTGPELRVHGRLSWSKERVKVQVKEEVAGY